MPIKLTLLEFISKAKEVHGDTYDYSHVLYYNTKTRINIVCKIHGEFSQFPTGHLAGNGCPICSIKKVYSNTEEFIEKARSVHKNSYDYSGAFYSNNKTPIKVCCNKHGPFLIRPANHLNGSGCPVCWKEKLSIKMTQDTAEEFIEKANRVHKGIYEYHFVKYVNTFTMVDIICPYHGVFSQIPSNHLIGRGCKICGRTRQVRLISRPMGYFINKASLVHDNKYEYNHANYKNLHIKVEIRCKKHGSFEQTPNNHLSGHGCPMCNVSKGEKKIQRALKGMGLIFEMGKKFEGCKHKMPLRFDFFVPQFNTLIEYDGRQHFQPVDFGNNDPKIAGIKFQENLIRDGIKNQFCEKTGIKLIRIPYFQFDCIEEILNSHLPRGVLP